MSHKYRGAAECRFVPMDVSARPDDCYSLADVAEMYGKTEEELMAAICADELIAHYSKTTKATDPKKKGASGHLRVTETALAVWQRRIELARASGKTA